MSKTNMNTIYLRNLTSLRNTAGLLTLAASLGLGALSSSAAVPLVAGTPIVVADSKGGFDYLQVDVAQRRFLANHTGNNSFDVFDVDTGQFLKRVATGKAQGVAVDAEAGKYFVSVSAQRLVVVIDSKTLKKTGEVKLSGPADALVLNPKNHCLYVGHDDGPEVWVIDTKTEKIVASIAIPEGPEYVLYDPVTDQVFQNIKSNDSLLVIDPASNTIKQRWATAPAQHPHGLALDSSTHRLFCAGVNGKLAVMDALTGRVLSSVDMAKNVDQIAFDAGLKRVYCASRDGVLSVLEETGDGARVLGNVKTAPGAKTVAVDLKTHAVWTAYADKAHSYILKLTVP